MIYDKYFKKGLYYGKYFSAVIRLRRAIKTLALLKSMSCDTKCSKKVSITAWRNSCTFWMRTCKEYHDKINSL